VELGLRLTEAGHRIELAPDIQGKHLKDWTLPAMVRCDVAHRAVPWLTLLLVRRRLPTALNLRWRHRISALASVGLAGVVGARRYRAVVPAVAVLVVLNRAFYGLLWEKLGPRRTALGVGLHVVHHLSAVVAAPLALLSFLRARRDLAQR
jgi:hypothetical protein